MLFFLPRTCSSTILFSLPIIDPDILLSRLFHHYRMGVQPCCILQGYDDMLLLEKKIELSFVLLGLTVEAASSCKELPNGPHKF